jgi:hypothetical protein
MYLASLSAPMGALAAIGLCGWVAAALAYGRLRRQQAAPKPENEAAPGYESSDGYESYQLLLDTLDRSNILLWWARVTREGTSYAWKIRTPPMLHDNSIYLLAQERNAGGLWRDEQAPDNARTKLVSAKALDDGLSGYQQEFRIIGADGVHWLNEEVLIRAAEPNVWNLAGVVLDITKRRDAEEARKQSEGQMEKIMKGADCLLWQAYVSGVPDESQKWHMFIPPSLLYKKMFGQDSEPGQQVLWTEEMVPEWKEINLASRKAMTASASTSTSPSIFWGPTDGTLSG